MPKGTLAVLKRPLENYPVLSTKKWCLNNTQVVTQTNTRCQKFKVTSDKNLSSWVYKNKLSTPKRGADGI